ncbi:lipase [Bacillus cereus group sp. MYBK249-1]|uniref:lipase n=1 Tax=Bacillus TaxID=1386 RepID=UPI002A347B2F|nr:lipase [Bacillus cereus]HDR4463646.1 lipase [Bacillus cereus]HDR6756880.1 lipase [Bacillus cereus]
MGNSTNDLQRFKINSDVGKLRLAAADIYAFNEKEDDYSNPDPGKNKKRLEDNFDAELIAEDDQHPQTGFGAYALKDNHTGEIFIVYVGTQPSQIGDLATDGAIGLHNLTNSPIFGSLAEFQYSQAERFYEKVKADNKGKKITLLGHSLGGGAANTVALRHQEDNINVLALNPAPVLNKDVVKYGYGTNMKNCRSLINEYDPLYGAIKAADFVIPGQVYKMENGEGHSFLYDPKFYSGNGNVAIDKLKKVSETGFDWKFGFLEISESAGDLYKGITGKKTLSTTEEVVVDLVVNGTPVSAILVAITVVGDTSALATKIASIGVETGKKALKFSKEVILEVRNQVNAAVDWIENKLAKCKEKVLEVLESVFNAAVDFLVGCIILYLSRDEIIIIAKEVASSLVQDILDVFKGDFEIDTNIASIAGDYVRSHRQSLLNYFMNDGSRGLNRSLLVEISRDVNELSNDLKELSQDVTDAVISMIAKDEELASVSYY